MSKFYGEINSSYFSHFETTVPSLSALAANFYGEFLPYLLCLCCHEFIEGLAARVDKVRAGHDGITQHRHPRLGAHDLLHYLLEVTAAQDGRQVRLERGKGMRFYNLDGKCK